MNFLQKKLWITWSKLRFFRLPVERRVRLEVTTDGRHITFLLVSLYEAGYGVQVFGGDWFFRELMLLRKSTPIPFLYGGKEHACGISISDQSGFNHREHGGLKKIFLDYDYFSRLTTKDTKFHERKEPRLRLASQAGAPYFMHPSVYHRGLHEGSSTTRLSSPDSAAKLRRRFRIGFFGTHDREFYSNYYHFSGMNRFEILEAFFEKFGDSFVNLEGPPEQGPDSKVVVSIDTRGGDRIGKSFLSQDHYFEALRECDFVLSPPGWCMPVSHNLIEAMFCGAIPITNGGAFMAEPLKDGKTCLEFQDEETLVSVIERALAMDADEVARMRLAVWDYHERLLKPKAFGQALRRSESGRVLVNAEENSVRLVFPEMVFPWDIPAKVQEGGGGKLVPI